jgi:hypothetical protein
MARHFEHRRDTSEATDEVNLLDQGCSLLGGFSTPLEATCLGNFEIAFKYKTT